MNLSINWLKEHIDLEDISDAQIAEELTNVGLEVEGEENYSSASGNFDGVVVGYVESVEPHPDPEVDKLRITSVNIGAEEPVQIVCGAPNVAKGQNVPVATIGTKLQFSDGKELKIKKGKIRGEISMGMICAEDELGIGDSHDGIMVLPESLKAGTKFLDVLNPYVDRVLEIGLTPNRVDAACHRGAARDMAARLDKELRVLDFPILDTAKTSESPVTIRIEDSEACPRYAGLVIEGVTIQDSPEWLQNKLKAIGLQPINNVVDITNFVMHDLGHPMHAFDLSNVEDNSVVVRRASEGELLTTLDEKERTMKGDELLICDAAKPMALAGVIGGQDSSISAETTNILLEAAYFNPSVVRKAAKTHQVSTDSSFRFERGADPNFVLPAISRAAELVIELAGGKLKGNVVDCYPNEVAFVAMDFDLKYLQKMAGYEIDRDRVLGILRALDFIVTESADSDTIKLVVPSNKPDVTRPVDVVEEVMRLHGYEHVPLNLDMKISLPSNKKGGAKKMKQKIASVLNGEGFFEVKTSPFTTEKNDEQVVVKNPLSAELTHLRSSQLESGLSSLAHNLNRQQKSVRFFETANEYRIVEDSYSEAEHVALWATGDRYQDDSWFEKNAKLDFNWFKGVAEKMLSSVSIGSFTAVPIENDSQWEYGLKLSTRTDELGVIGLLSADLCEQNEVNANVWAAQINYKVLLKAFEGQKLKYSEPGKFPRVIRDLSFVLSDDVKYADIEKAVASMKVKNLVRVNCFDIYKGKPLEAGYISYALRFVFEDKQKTLQDKQIDYGMNQITKALEGIGCQIRK